MLSVHAEPALGLNCVSLRKFCGCSFQLFRWLTSFYKGGTSGNDVRATSVQPPAFWGLTSFQCSCFVSLRGADSASDGGGAAGLGVTQVPGPALSSVVSAAPR